MNMRSDTTSSARTRRDFLKTAAAGGAAAAALAASGAASGTETSGDRPAADRRRVLRLAHLTDVHVQPELRAAEGMAACLRHVQSRPDAPEMILFGGDCVMDAFAQTRERADAQWDVWKRVLKAECSLPWVGCVGNHDVWGWNRERSRAEESDPRYGKGWAVEALEMPERYRVLDKAGWRIFILDSTHAGSKPGSYTAKLDEEQAAWFEAELRATPRETPVLVLSHIPIFAACPFFDGANESSGDWRVPGAWMHIDARRWTALFHELGNVRACLSGHIHLQDEVKYLGTRYFCNGAVSGGWWKGRCQQFGEGYALVDLHDDGSVECEYVEYGWKA